VLAHDPSSSCSVSTPGCALRRFALTYKESIGELAQRVTDKEHKIEFLFWQDCPSYPAALRRLQEVMAAIGDSSPIQAIEVLTDQDAERLAFPGSPTIRVDGVDVDPYGAAQMGAALTCRIYRLEDGRISPLPSADMIRRALTGQAGT
jgi:hypothetical protein